MAERKLNGKTYKVDPLPAGDALELYTDLMRFIGLAAGKLPAIVLAAHSADEGQNLMADVTALSALADVLKQTTSSEVRAFIQRVTEIAMIMPPSGQYRRVDLDGDFTGRLGELLPLVRFVLEVQFGDFFPGSRGGGILGLLREVLQTPKSAG